LKGFLYNTSRELSNEEIAQLSGIIRDEKFSEACDLLGQLGNELLRLYQSGELDRHTSNTGTGPRANSISNPVNNAMLPATTTPKRQPNVTPPQQSRKRKRRGAQ